jgi:hypothetical protein
VKINAAEYFYIPPHDALMCKTLVKAYNTHREKGGTFEDFFKAHAKLDTLKDTNTFTLTANTDPDEG